MPINLQKFKTQHEEMKQRREGKKDDEKFWIWPLDKGKKATFLTRLLPTKSGFVTDDDSGWEIKATHSIGQNEKGYANKVLCLNYHGSESRCPACAIAGKIYRNTDSVEYKEIGKGLFSDRKYWYNAVFKNMDGDWIDKEGNTTKEPIVYKYCVPRTLQEGKGDDDEDSIQSLFLKYGDISDLKSGRWIEMKVEIGDMGPNYKNVSVKEPTLLDNDLDIIKKVMSNLNILIITQKITLYDEMVHLLEDHFDTNGHPELKKMFTTDGKKTEAKNQVAQLPLQAPQEKAAPKSEVTDDLLSELGINSNSKPTGTPATKPIEEKVEEPKPEESKKRKKKEEPVAEEKPAEKPKIEEKKPTPNSDDLDAELEKILNS